MNGAPARSTRNGGSARIGEALVGSVAAGLVVSGVQAARIVGADQLGLTLGEGWRDLGWEAAAAAALIASATTVALIAGRWWGAAARRRSIFGLQAVLMVAMVTASLVARPHPSGAGRVEGAPIADAGAPTTLLLITADTLRRDHVGIHPGAIRTDLTPSIDALARRGIRFDEALAPAPLTLPVHTSILTGLPPDQTGVVQNGRRIPGSLAATPQQLGLSGWRTGAFVSSSVLHGAHGLDDWFHTYRDSLGEHPFADWLLLGRWLSSRDKRNTARLQKERGDRTVARALSWLGGVDDDERVLLWVHLYDAHAPHDGHDGVGGLPDRSIETDLPDPCRWEEHPSAFHRGPMAHRFRLGRVQGRCAVEPTGAARRFATGYAREVGFLDRQVGALTAGLEELGRWEDAAVIFVSDHGESITEHNQLGTHQFSLYDPVVRVPLILRLPGDEGAGSVVTDPTSTVQIGRTLLELAGLPAAPELVGPSLVAAADGRERGRSTLYAIGPAPGRRGPGGVNPAGPRQIQVIARSGARKVLVDSQGTVERYRIADDPHERWSLISQEESDDAEQSLSRPPNPSARRPRTLAPLPPGLDAAVVLRPIGDPGGPVPEYLLVEAALGRVVPPQEVAEFATEEGLARAVLESWSERRGDPSDDLPLPEQIEESLRALGYVQ